MICQTTLSINSLQFYCAKNKLLAHPWVISHDSKRTSVHKHTHEHSHAWACACAHICVCMPAEWSCEGSVHIQTEPFASINFQKPHVPEWRQKMGMLARSVSFCQELLWIHENKASREGKAQNTQRHQCVQEYSALSWQKTQKQQWKQPSDVILNLPGCQERQLVGCALRSSLSWVHVGYFGHMCHHRGHVVIPEHGPSSKMSLSESQFCSLPAL